MRAIVQERYGLDPDEVFTLAERPEPTPEPDEVLVRVAAAGVDRGTWHIMAGLPLVARPVLGWRGPKQQVPGLDVAGTVLAVGAEVDGFTVGDEVLGIAQGSFAEVAAAKAAKLAHRPSALDPTAAAALPVSGLTALQAVRDQARVAPGDRVLVLGASGGVGTYAVQVAKADGAEVTGTASTAKLDLVASLGADHVVDHATADSLAEAGRYDVILDIGGARRLHDLRRALTPAGRLVVVGGEGGSALIGTLHRQARALLWSPFVSQRLTTFVSSENGADVATLAAMAAAGTLIPAVERTYPLAEAAVALRHLADGKARGKLVVVP